MTWVEAGVEVIKAPSWPVAFTIVSLILGPRLLYWLHSLVQRKVELEGFGLKAKIDVAEQQQKVAAENPVTEKLAEPAALNPSSRLAVNLLENMLREQLEQIETEKQVPMLLRGLAETRVLAGHEFIYNRIFGSQITFLKRLNEVPRTTIEEAKQFFAPYAAQFPHIYDTYGFDGWLGFLKKNLVIEQHDGLVQINEFGRDFLVYVTEQRLAELKLG
jgi:hypothetical protein